MVLPSKKKGKERGGAKLISSSPRRSSHLAVAAAFFCPEQPVYSDSIPEEIAGESFAVHRYRSAYNPIVKKKGLLAAVHATRPPFLGPRKDTTHFMGTPTQTMPPQMAPAPVPAPSSAPAAPRTIHTAQLVTAMLKSSPHVSDLIFSPGRAPQIEVSGQLTELKYKGLECLSSQDTLSIA